MGIRRIGTMTLVEPLELRLAEFEPGPGLVAAHVVGEARVLYVHPEVQLDDRDVRTASAVKGPNGGPAVQVHLHPSGVKRFNAMAKSHRSKTVAIIACGRIVSAPVIEGALVDDLLDITGTFTCDEAAALAKALSTPSVPCGGNK